MDYATHFLLPPKLVVYLRPQFQDYGRKRKIL